MPELEAESPNLCKKQDVAERQRMLSMFPQEQIIKIGVPGIRRLRQ
jgi:hypothetical protein